MTLDLDRVVAALPGYEVGAELGRGGWGVVLSGRHRQLGREVAIKQLPLAFAADPAVRSRFVAEARIIASLEHPHIVPIYDFVEDHGLCLLVMEKLSGGTVWSRFTGDGVTPNEACAIVLATSAALHFAHQHGILHRDVKPENLMFGPGEVLKVTDFGIAKVLGGAETLATRAGEVLGTPAYMAPEQAQGAALSAATDVYAAGVVLFELLSGQLPFPDDGDPLAVVYRHVHEQPARLDEVAPSVSRPISEVVMRALATSPQERYPSAEHFGVALAEAATEAWEPGWLERVDLPVMAAGPMVAATERPSGPAARRVQATGSPRPRRAPVTLVAGEPEVVSPPGPDRARTARSAEPIEPAEPAAHAVVGLSPVKPATPGPRVRPSVAFRTPPVMPDPDADLVPVRNVIARRRAPRAPLVAAGALFLVALTLAFVGIGSTRPTGGFPAGAVSVNGADPAANEVVRLDLSHPVTVALKGPLGASHGERIRLSFSVAGMPIGSAQAVATPRPGGGGVVAVIDTSKLRYVARRTTARIELVGAPGRAAGAQPSPGRTFAAQSPFVGAPVVLGAAAGLIVVGFAEALLGALRRGRTRLFGLAGLVAAGAAIGAGAVFAAWLAGGHEPTTASTLVCASAGALAGFSAGLGALGAEPGTRSMRG